MIEHYNPVTKETIIHVVEEHDLIIEDLKNQIDDLYENVNDKTVLIESLLKRLEICEKQIQNINVGGL